MKFNYNSFIGIFDSGIGGISVLNSCMSFMPNENYVYFADSKNFPYGIKSKSELADIGIKILSSFYNLKAKETIIACNTMSTCNFDLFVNRFKDMHIIGTFPNFIDIFKSNTILKENTIKFNKNIGIQITKNKIKLLIIATKATCNSNYLNNLRNDYKDIIDIYIEPADFIVEAVENNKLDCNSFKSNLSDFFKQYKNIDYLLLGCTHFAHATNLIKEILGNDIQIFSGANTAAKDSFLYLKENSKFTYSPEPYIRIIDSNLNDSRKNLYAKLINTNSNIIFDIDF